MKSVNRERMYNSRDAQAGQTRYIEYTVCSSVLYLTISIRTAASLPIRGVTLRADPGPFMRSRSSTVQTTAFGSDCTCQWFTSYNQVPTLAHLRADALSWGCTPFSLYFHIVNNVTISTEYSRGASM